ncbi:MAG: hypothetical protein ACJA1A_003612 [Saprospiraceae bacterium]|jgi:hypothetical protein
MKRTLLLGLSMLFMTSLAIGQSFADDFDSYTAGDYLAASNSEWTTWGGTTGTSEDVRITDENSFSGTNSIKFVGVGAGGPQDVVKYFTGEKLTTGVLKTNMQLLVETGAYFNYQAEVTIGTTWAMNAFFEANGQGRITGSGNGDILTFEYPTGEWFDFKMNINFDANKWQLEVNGICVGSFENPDNSIASIDIYPVSGNSFFVDDFGYEYSEEAPEIVNDAIVGMRTPEASALAGKETSFTGELKNGGLTVIESFMLEATLGSDVYPIEMSGLSLATGETTTFNISDAFAIPEGNSTASLEIVSINGGTFADEDLCNDKSTIALFGLVPADHKKVIIEEATGTWCGWCPRGTVALDRFSARYPDRYIGVAVHNADPMVNADYDDGLGAGSFPNSLVNRGDFIDPGATEAPFLERVVESSAASILQGAEWDADTRELKISLVLTAQEAISTNHKVNVAITEDGVSGTGTGWAQVNYYSGGADLIGVDGVNWADLPDPVPAADMVYDHVARAILAPYTGLENSFTEDMAVDDEKIFNFFYTVPADFNIDNIHIVSMLINPNGTINTGEGDPLMEDIDNGFVEAPTSTYDPELNNAVNVFPNPMTNFTNVRINLSERSDVSLQVVDMSGKSVMNKVYENQNGLFSIVLDANSLSNGTYVLKINAGDKYTTKKITVVK